MTNQQGNEMSKAQHTPGPWKLESYRLYAGETARAEYPIHAPKRGLIVKAYREFDANRIVSCVNACEGISTEALEGGVLRELREALEWYIANDDTDITPENEFWLKGLEKARTAISKAKEII